MADWHPVDTLEPAEWFLRPMRTSPPVVVIRRLVERAANGQTEDVWFRVVTWAASSEDRELIGWCRTLEAAAAAGWDYHLALGSWMHNVAAVPRNGPPPPKPPAAEMLRFYRQHLVTRERKVRA
jgi:hypothetical protein